MDTNIICAIIQAMGTILAAIVAAFFAKTIVKKDIKPILQSYSDKSHDLRKMIEKARHNIVIVVAAGDKLLSKYEDTIKEKLDSRVHVYYLFLERQKFLEMAQYMQGKAVEDTSDYDRAKHILNRLHAEYEDCVRARVFPYFMAASYIGIDIPFESEQGYVFTESVIQTMLYQYRVMAKDDPITYISLKKNERHYNTTIQSIKNMWHVSAEYF